MGVKEQEPSDSQDEEEEDAKQRRNSEEEDGYDASIDDIAKDGDLSPRQTEGLKSGARKNKSILPLQVKTRSSQEKSSRSTQ